MKIRLKGTRSHGKLYLSGLKSQGIDIKKIPPYFELELETDTIVAREKSRSSPNHGYKSKEISPIDKPKTIGSQNTGSGKQ